MDYHRNLAVMANNPHRKRRYQNFATTTTSCTTTTTIEVTLTETSSRTSSPLPLTTLATELPILTVNRIENLPSTIFQKCPHTEFVTEIEQKFDEKTAFFASSSSPQDTIETTTPSIPTITTKSLMMFSNRLCLCCDSQFTKTISESGFLKFLTRFSGRRRNMLRNCHKLFSTLISLLMLLSLCSVSEACSSRTTPKPRPPPTPSPRPNITFHTYKCPPTYAAWYCLNDATCFTVKIGDEILYNCECADGYMGPRCEYKDLDGSYLPTRPRVMLETASIASGATLALIFVLILCLILYVRCHQRQKLDRLAENGVDTVDGLVHTVRCEHLERRPFGPHHYYTIPMAATLKR